MIKNYFLVIHSYHKTSKIFLSAVAKLWKLSASNIFCIYSTIFSCFLGIFHYMIQIISAEIILCLSAKKCN